MYLSVLASIDIKAAFQLAAEQAVRKAVNESREQNSNSVSGHIKLTCLVSCLTVASVAPHIGSLLNVALSTVSKEAEKLLWSYKKHLTISSCCITTYNSFNVCTEKISEALHDYRVKKSPRSVHSHAAQQQHCHISRSTAKSKRDDWQKLESQLEAAENCR